MPPHEPVSLCLRGTLRLEKKPLLYPLITKHKFPLFSTDNFFILDIVLQGLLLVLLFPNRYNLFSNKCLFPIYT